MAQPYTGPNLGPLQPIGDQQGDPWGGLSDAPPDAGSTGTAGAASGTAQGDPWSDLSDAAPETTPTREVGSGEAALRGVAHGLSFGTSPAIAGVEAASTPDVATVAKKFGIDPDKANNFLDEFFPAWKAVAGAGRLAYDAATSDTQTPAQAAYSKQRQDTADTEAAASEQHPYIYGGGDIAGSLAAPIPGAGALKAASLAERVGEGIRSGATAGALFGAGEPIGQGKPVSDVVQGAGKGVLIGGAAGGALGGALGPRAVTVATTPGEKAAETSAGLGAGLPRGLSSDSPFVQATTQQARQVPWAGKRIDIGAGKTVAAAGKRIGEIVDTLTPTSERSATDLALQTPLENAITNNKGKVDTAYDAVRAAINPDQRFPMPKTESALHAVKLTRERAGWTNPGEGLEQAQNLVDKGGGFNGVHRARSDMYNAGKSVSPHPGYDKGDFNRIRRALDADLKNNVRKAAANPNEAESLFNTAEITFKQAKTENDLVQKLLNAKGEGGIAELLGAGKEKGGNLALLAQIKGSVPKESFERISGTLLNELGHNTSTGKFSLNQLTSGWDKLSDSAKGILFSPAHQKSINDIVEMGRQIKGGDQYANTSNTAGALILFDVIKTAAETGVGVMAGVVSPAAAAGVGVLALAADLLTRFLASPAKAASMSAWARAYRGITLNQPTPARIAAFRITTRNLANNVNIPVSQIESIISSHLGRAGADQADEKKNN